MSRIVLSAVTMDLISRWVDIGLLSMMRERCSMSSLTALKGEEQTSMGMPLTETIGLYLRLVQWIHLVFLLRQCLEFLIGVRHMPISESMIQLVGEDCCGIGSTKMTTGTE